MTTDLPLPAMPTMARSFTLWSFMALLYHECYPFPRTPCGIWFVTRYHGVISKNNTPVIFLEFLVVSDFMSQKPLCRFGRDNMNVIPSLGLLVV